MDPAKLATPKKSLAEAIFSGSKVWTRDANGKPVKLAEQKKKYESIDTDERVTESVARAADTGIAILEVGRHDLVRVSTHGPKGVWCTGSSARSRAYWA